MRVYWSCVDFNSTTGVLMREKLRPRNLHRRKTVQRQPWEKMPCDNRGRDQNDVSTNQEKPKMASHHQSRVRGQGGIPPFGAFRGSMAWTAPQFQAFRIKSHCFMPPSRGALLRQPYCTSPVPFPSTEVVTFISLHPESELSAQLHFILKNRASSSLLLRQSNRKGH